MDTKTGAIRGKFVTLFGICSLQPSKPGLERPGEGLGRVFDGLGEGFGTVFEGSGEPSGARPEPSMEQTHGDFATLVQGGCGGRFGEAVPWFRGRLRDGFCLPSNVLGCPLGDYNGGKERIKFVGCPLFCLRRVRRKGLGSNCGRRGTVRGGCSMDSGKAS